MRQSEIEKAGEAVQALEKAMAAEYDPLLVKRLESQEDLDWAAGVLSKVKSEQRRITSERDDIVKPMREAMIRVSALFDRPLRFLRSVEDHLKGETKRYTAEAEIALAQMLTDAQTPDEVEAAVAVMAKKPENISHRVAWRWEVADLAAVPKDYFVLDEARISLEVRRLGDDCKIPGVRVIKDSTVVVRGAK
jgi:hypothetical protein